MKITPRSRRVSNPAECFFCNGQGTGWTAYDAGGYFSDDFWSCSECGGTGKSQLGLILDGRLEPPANFECGTTVLKVGGDF